jgi:hypothetical protein
MIMDKKEEKNKLFWQQYHGLVRAIDLPQWYKVEDKRISCVNNECFLKDNCLFWDRHFNSQVHFDSLARERAQIAKYQAFGIKRNVWEKNKDQPNYFLASFQFCPQQKGTTCEYFTKKS